MNFLPAISVDDELMEMVFTRMLGAGLVKRTFPGGMVTTHDDWMKFVRSPINMVNLVTNYETVIAVSWLNGYRRNHAWGHFCMFPEVWGRSVEVGKFVLRKWFSMIKSLDVVLGRTPADNRLALAFLKKLGMVTVGTIPAIGFNSYRNEKTDIVLSYIKRGDI